MRAPLRGAACGGVARAVRPSARRSAGAPAVDQPQLRVFAPRLVGDVRLGMAGLRPLERRDDLGLVVFDARRAVRRDARLDLPQYAGLHVVPYGEQAGAQGVGLHAAGRGLDRYRILVHRGRILVSVAAAGQRFRERHMGRAVVRIHGRFRRYAVGAGLQPALFRGVAASAQRAALGACGAGRRRAGSRVACDLCVLGGACAADRDGGRAAQRRLLRQVQYRAGVAARKPAVAAGRSSFVGAVDRHARDGARRGAQRSLAVGQSFARAVRSGAGGRPSGCAAGGGGRHL